MKRVVQIQRQGKVNDVRASAAVSGLPTEEIDSTVALIQALIPLGLQAVRPTGRPERDPAPPGGEEFHMIALGGVSGDR